MMRRPLAVILGMTVAASPALESAEPAQPSFKAPLQSRTDLRVRHMRIPAPRGLVIDRRGEPLVQTRAARYLALRLFPYRRAGNPSKALATIRQQIGSIPELASVTIDEKDFATHWKHRPEFPFPLTEPLREELADRLAPLVGAFPGLVLEKRFVRDYPAGPSAAHLTGYVRSSMPIQHGPPQDPELAWPGSEGVRGLEKSFESEIAGQDGLASRLFNDAGEPVETEMIEPAVPGKTVVTTINRAMQELAYQILEENKRPGAFVAVDSLSGDILAMVSYPSFDPEEFSQGISRAEFDRLESDPDGPLFPKAELGLYPPGSTFKPIVALAALDCGVIRGTLTRLPCTPYLTIQGRVFRNWSGEDEGYLDVRYALLRSNNTWFYQAGMLAGGDRLRRAAEVFGFGTAPEIFLPAAAGSLPSAKNVSASQAVANFSIGQGELLVSPLQLAIAMAGFSAGNAVPKARLIQQIQDPETNEVLKHFPEETLNVLNTRPSDRDAVRAGMWGVVNHPDGTGKSAAHPLPEVFGKTGTSQWNAGRNVAWFSGYVGSNSPRIALVAMVQGRDGESLSGGKNAGPLVGEWVRRIYAEPERYDVRNTRKQRMNYLPASAPATVPPALTQQGWNGSGIVAPSTVITPAPGAAPAPPKPISLRRFFFNRDRGQ